MWFEALFIPSPAPPLTLDNVLKAVKGVKNSNHLGEWGFGVLDTDSIKRQHDSDEAQCLKAVVEKFLLGEGRYQPSWRAVIYTLDMENEVELADKIRSFGEPVQGECSYLFIYSMCKLRWSYLILQMDLLNVVMYFCLISKIKALVCLWSRSDLNFN